jgi:hypothetical protein
LFDNFCNKIELQKLIGTVDVKSTPTYFYAQMTASYSTVNTAVPFGSAKVNVGNAFTASTGIFVAPTPGRLLIPVLLVALVSYELICN